MSFDPGRVKAICFDVDGTLSDTDDKWVAQIEERLRSIKPLLLHSDLHKTARWMVMVSESPMNAVYHWADALSLDDNIARIYERLIRSHKQAKRNFWLMAGALEILDDLAALAGNAEARQAARARVEPLTLTAMADRLLALYRTLSPVSV